MGSIPGHIPATGASAATNTVRIRRVHSQVHSQRERHQGAPAQGCLRYRGCTAGCGIGLRAKGKKGSGIGTSSHWERDAGATRLSPVTRAMMDRVRARSLTIYWGWRGDQHGELAGHPPALGRFLSGISAKGGCVPCTGTSAMRAVWRGEGSGYGPSPCDPPAKHRPSVVPGGLRAHTCETVSPPPGGGGGWQLSRKWSRFPASPPSGTLLRVGV